MDLNPNFKYVVYKTTNKINGKMYVGCHKTLDPNDDYIGSGMLLKRAIRKYGRENFVKYVLFVFDSPTAMFEKEREIVNKLFVEAENTYNLLIGGSGGFDYVNSTGKNIYGKNGSPSCGGTNLRNGKIIKELLIERGLWDEFLKRTSDSVKQYYAIHGSHWTGRKHKASSKRKMSETMKKISKGENNSQFGTCWIYNPQTLENAKIKKEAIEPYLANGWVKGRKV